MAEIDFYKTYVAISSSSDKSNNIAETVLAKFLQLKRTSSIIEVKRNLQESFDITKNNGAVYIEGGYPVNLYEDNEIFSVNIVINDKDITYCYRKGA